MADRLNLNYKIGQGITPQQFMDGMQVRSMEFSKIPNTKEQFISNYDNFEWLDERDRKFFADLNKEDSLHCLILCTDWCPDVIWSVPVLFRVMELLNIQTEVLPMADHLETMDLFLTDGGRTQPMAVFLNAAGDVLGQWGARPAYIQIVMDRFKQNHTDKQAIDYEQNLNRVYGEIGDLYHAGRTYQNAMLGELKVLFGSIIV